MRQSIIALVAVFVLAFGFGAYRYYGLSKEYARLMVDFEVSQKNLTDERAAQNYLIEKLRLEQDRSGAFSQQIVDLLGTVDTLDKLSKTDKELLQKYSKVYFLNEHYVPENLDAVPKDFLQDKTKTIEEHASVAPFLTKMLADAKSANSPILVISGYRSFGDQSSLKTSYKVTYGVGSANAFSADQGYSEHQLGTTFDFTTPDLGNGFDKFENSSAYTWLQNNAYLYGFVLSYPKGNTYYVFEPWHWRFVGIKLATYLHDKQESFYDVDQRTIDSYLGSVFDQ